MESTYQPRRFVARGLTFLALVLASYAVAESPGLIGNWTLNNDLTREVQPAGKETHRMSGTLDHL